MSDPSKSSLVGTRAGVVELNGAGAGVGVAKRAEVRTGVSSGAGVEPLTAPGGLTGVPLTEAGLHPTLLFFLFFECLRIEVRSKCCRRNSALLSSLLTSANLFLRGDLSASAQNVPSPGKRLADSAETRAMEHVASGRTRANYIEAFGWNADLSTLASVVTSLATMRSEAFAGSGAMNNTSSPAPNVKMEEEDDSEDSASTNDDAAVANALHLAKENLISKAFDTMAKVRTSGFRLPDRAD